MNKKWQVWASEQVWYMVEVEAETESEAMDKANDITDWGSPLDGDDFDIRYADLA